MRHAGAVIVLLLGLPGCFVPGTKQTVSRSPRPDQPLDSRLNLVQLDVALLERPVGDPFLNGELWNYTDEQVVGLDRKGVLDGNGFRIGQIVGMPPGRLQALLTSERSCINPRRRLLPSGRSADQVLGPNWLHADFVVHHNGEAEEVSLDQAQFVLEVTPILAEDGRTTLRLVPKVQHGEAIPDWRPATDGSEWTFQMIRPHKAFTALSCEVNVTSNSYIVVGANFEQPDSLGYRSFVQDQDGIPVQRLLVMRLGRSGQGQDSLPALMNMSPPGAPLPLALQATMSVRASAP